MVAVIHRMDFEIPMPPRVPEAVDELELAVKLVGALAKGQKLKPANLERLQQLLGAVPTPRLAAEWKRELKVLRKDLEQDTL